MPPLTDEGPAGPVLDVPHVAEPISAHDEHGAGVPAAVDGLVADAPGVTARESGQNLYGIEMEGEDEHDHDDDSAIGGISRFHSTTSVQSSVYEFVEENGRTYHRYKEGKYVMPNDEIEQDRLDMQHQLWLMTLSDKLHLAPIKPNPNHILDIGTGTGIWAIDCATMYPTASVIGSDLSPIQPAFVPPNCQFEVEDVEDEWTYTQGFDFIHGRLLVSCFKDPRAVFIQAFAHLAPGGYFEMQDADFPLRCIDDSMRGTALEQWNGYIVDGAARAGRPWTNTKKYKQWMLELGFVDVHEKLFRWPLNTWPRDPHLKMLGLWFQHDLTEGLNSTKAVLTRGLKWSNEEAEMFLVDVRKDIKNRAVHAYASLHVVYGKKPDVVEMSPPRPSGESEEEA
ncbi:hypothetical protein BP5796_11922 [Coleophoma crateriformis]|uniref:S-adenosyl-L-methionine-dependent methyltransferase n=1 Tax=Coleophoma crateriformis TaxID=565419 RepID=A0A3D8QEN8_9HELO|nr:hypothetical protein BP5796_11922 [Coleophoma crateriformis]